MLKSDSVVKKTINILIIILTVFFAFGGIISVKIFFYDKDLKLVSTPIANIDSEPEFYGTIGINLKVGDELDLTNSVFRIFAKDFYDGDLTQSIKIIENTVDTEKAGDYKIKYSVQNSLGKSATIEVPIKVSNNQERTVKRKLYGAEDTWNVDIADSKRGHYQDRQNLGIYAEAGANIKIREINNYNNSNIVGDFLNNNQNTEKEFNITSDWTTITPEVDSVPFIKSLNIDSRITYQHSYDTDYMIRNITSFEQENNNTIFFSNVFERKNTNETVNEIIIPVYNCEEAKVYINVTDNNINSEEYNLVRTIKNPSNGYATIRLLEPVKVESDKFIIAVEYTGETVPVNYGTKKYTYLSSVLNSDWELLKEYSLLNGYLNVPPIICKTNNKDENKLPIIEVNIEEIFEEDSLIKPLDYYLYGDDEEKFFEKWEDSQNSYAVLENDRVTFLTPIGDKNKILKNTINKQESYSYNSVTEIFDIYNDIFQMYDSFLGLEDKAEEEINQNIKTKYFIKADDGYPNKNAVAYYAINKYTAQVGTSIISYFYKNWLPLHEVGHGYEGFLDGGRLNGNNIDLSEAANNIFAYYYQQTYLTGNDYGWMGSISAKEKSWNNIRKNLGEDYKFNEIRNESYSGTDQYHVRLYVMVNLLNKLGPQELMSSYYRSLRADRANGNNTSNVDLLTKSACDVLGYNIIPYLESWNIEVSEDLKKEIENKNVPMLYYLRDLVKSDDKATEIKNDLKLDGMYALVSNEDINKYNLTGAATIQLTDTEYEKFKGKSIKLKSGTNVIEEANISSKNIEFKNAPIGIYDIEITNTTENIEKEYLIIQGEPDSVPPELSKIEVISPSAGEYTGGQEIILKATFNEKISVKGVYPRPILKFGGNQSKGSISVYDIGVQEIVWQYMISCEDKGELSVDSIDLSNITDISGNRMQKIDKPSLTGYKITAKGHKGKDPVQENIIQATCVKNGSYEEFVDCSVCGIELSRRTITIVAGHIIVQHGGKQATCTQKGWEAYQTCERCDYTTYKEIAAGHRIVKHGGKPATCTQKGWEAYQTCERCSYTTYKEKAALEHRWGEWIETRPATETENGEEKRVCQMDDSHIDTRIIPAENHVHTIVKINRVEATCTEKGRKEYWECSGCKRMFSDKEAKEEIEDKELVIIPTTNHSWGVWIVTKEATYTEEGQETRTCKNDDKHIETRALPKLINTKPEIIFKDKEIIIDNNYAIVGVAGITEQEFRLKIDENGIAGQTVTIENITSDGKLKTGTEVKLNGNIQFVVVVKGDVNGDGKIGPIDVTNANKLRARKENAGQLEIKAADMDWDGIIKPIDITILNNRRIIKYNIKFSKNLLDYLRDFLSILYCKM